jgi:hypothetical protein
MNTYVVSIDNSVPNNKTNKTVEDLLEEYKELLKKLKKYDSDNIPFFIFRLLFLVFLIVSSQLPLFIIYILFVLLGVYCFSHINYVLKEQKKNKDEIKEIKIKLLTALKQEKFVIEHNKEFYCSRFMLSLYARNNESFWFANKRINAQKLLLEYPDIQKIAERKTTFEFLKLHNKHQELINKLCKEKEKTKIIYEN